MAKKARKTKRREEAEFEFGSGNVFEDFGLSSSREYDAKSDLALLIRSIIRQRKLTQSEAAKLMKIDQPKVSKIIRGLLSEFTMERLMRFLVALGYDIEIKPKQSLTPSIHVGRRRLRATAYTQTPSKIGFTA